MRKQLIGVFAVIALTLSLVGASASAFTASDIAVLKAIFGSSLTAAQNAALDALASPVASTVSSSGYTFTRNLTLGSTGADVKALQQFLNANGAVVSTSGAGSIGSESTYFGTKTKVALAKYQAANGIAPAVGYFGSITRARISSVGGTAVVGGTTVIPTGTGLVFSLAPTSPSTGAIVAGQSIADLVEYTFENQTAAPVVVTNVTLQRGGVSNDSALTNIYLYNGVNRLTDSASISSGKITFNAPAGLFTVPAMSKMTVAVKADIVSGTAYNGQTIIITLTNVSASVPVAGSLPLSGASQTISSATLSTVVVSSSSPAANAALDPQTDYVMWQGTVKVGNNDAWMKAFSLRQVGSVSVGDLGNFRLYVDGIQVGATLLSYDASTGYLTFDLSASPVKLATGNRTVKLIGDVIGGSLKTFSFSLRQASDINIVDSQLNVNVLATAETPGAVAISFPLTSGEQKVSTGSLTVTKVPSSPSGNVTLASSNVSLGLFQLKAYGEPVKVESLKVSYDGVNANFGGGLRNGALYANGAQIGSLATIGSTTVTTFNLGSSLVVYPGTPVIVDVRADIVANSGTAIANGDAFTVSLIAGSSNATLQKSLGTANVPSSNVGANQITVAQGTLALTKVTGYANQSAIVPQTAMKIGSYSMTAGNTEGLNINTITVSLLGTGASSTATTTQITDLYFTYNDGISAEKVSVNKQTVVNGDNDFQVNYVLPVNKTATINVYATLANTLLSTDAISTKVKISSQTSGSAQIVTAPASGYVQGQLITVTTGQLYLAINSTQASTSVVAVPDRLVKAGSYKFTASADAYTVTQLVGYVPAGSVGNVNRVVYKIGTQTLNDVGTGIDGVSGIATTTGLNIAVPANGTAVVVDAWLNLSAIGTPGGATSSSDITFTLDGYTKMSSTGVKTDMPSGQAKAGFIQYAYKTLPVVNLVSIPGTLSNTEIIISKFNIAADTAGSINWSKIVVNVTKTSATTLNSLKFQDSSGSTIPGTISSSSDIGNAGTSGTITFVPTDPEIIGAGESRTYQVLATVGGATTNSVVNTSIAAGSTVGHIQSSIESTAAGDGATFVWSDLSYSNHGVATPDWNNETLIKNIPTGLQLSQF
ncbi:MAG: peptidoglycan-binding domain-containing protein [Candidatus Paceibacterota bacterium]|jgi:hypothetical protein